MVLQRGQGTRSQNTAFHRCPQLRTLSRSNSVFSPWLGFSCLVLHLVERSRACRGLVQEEFSLRFVSEDQDRPSVGCTAPAQRLVAVVPVLEEVPTVAV